MSNSLIFLVQVFIVVVVPFAIHRLSRLKGLLPLVVVQILVGIALGPSMFGRLAPDYFQMVFNSQALSQLSGIASIAVLFFGLISGLHLDRSTVSGNGRAFVYVAAASIVAPTALGFFSGLWIVRYWPEEVGTGVTSTQFAEAIGICIGVTALPVLGAILYEMDLLGRRLGNIALGIAGVNDLVLWILLAVLLTDVAGQAPEGPGVLGTLIILPVYFALMATVVRPMLRRVIMARMKNGEIHESALAIVCAVTVGSSIVTQTLGLHYIFGAFVAGAIVPEDLRHAILDRVQVITVGLLMPFFFLLTGLRTFVDLSSSVLLEVFIISTAVAVVGKVGGTALAARIAGESWPNALGLGALLQTKGLMEVVVLSILRDGGIISSNVFSALILMAVVSTALAMPLARLLLGKEATDGESLRVEAKTLCE